MDQNKYIQLSQAEALKRALHHKGWSALKAAKIIGVHAQTLYNITGGARSISVGLARKLARQFEKETPESELSFWEQNPVLLPAGHRWVRDDDPIIEKLLVSTETTNVNLRKFELAAAYLCEALVDKAQTILAQFPVAFESMNPPLELEEDELREILQQTSTRVINRALERQNAAAPG